MLTDSDGAGFVIRSRIKSCIPGQYLKHAYIPDVYGKERRKKQRGREGKLGVEGMPPQVLIPVPPTGGGHLPGGGEGRAPVARGSPRRTCTRRGCQAAPTAAPGAWPCCAGWSCPEHLTANGFLRC